MCLVLGVECYFSLSIKALWEEISEAAFTGQFWGMLKLLVFPCPPAENLLPTQTRELFPKCTIKKNLQRFPHWLCPMVQLPLTTA